MGRRRRRGATAGSIVVLVLAFVVMVAAGAAVFPLSVAANKLSGLWITLCASMGIG